MVQISLTTEQLKALDESHGHAVLVDADGQPVCYATPIFTPEEIAEAQRRANSDGPWYTTQQVLEHLRTLERS